MKHIEKRCVEETIALCEIGFTVSFMDQTLVDLLRLKGKESIMKNESWNCDDHPKSG